MDAWAARVCFIEKEHSFLGNHLQATRANIGGGRDAPPAVPQGIAQRYLTLLLRQPGEFDKKSDIRKPERVVAYDLLSSKITASASIQSQGAVAELAALRGRHPGETTFLAHLPESQRVELIRGYGGPTGDPFLGVRLPITWPRPFALYEPATLRYQATEESLFASLTVDPVNAAAVARKKADPDILDLCAVDPQTGAARRLLALPGNARPTTWTATALPGGKSNTKESGVFTSPIRILEYKTNEFKVSAEADKPFYVNGDEATFTTQGDYLYGAPMAGAEVTTDFPPGDHEWSLWDAQLPGVLDFLLDIAP